MINTNMSLMSLAQTGAPQTSVPVATTRTEDAPVVKGDSVDIQSSPGAAAPRFKDSASSVKRDAVLTGLMIASAFLPPPARIIVAGVGGGLAMLTGFGELREGMRHMDTHEVFDGALHMLAGGAMVAAGTVGGPIFDAWALSGGVGLLAAKQALVDHPKEAIVGSFKEVGGLVKDGFLSVREEFRSHPKPEPQPDPKPEPPAPKP